jgi:cytochrome c6
VFERNGKEYVVVLAGGTALGGSKRSDGLWLFSLDGTVKSLPRGSADPAAAPRPAGPVPTAATGPAHAPDLAKGKDIYTTTCVVCHGPTGLGGTHGGARLTRALTPDGIATVLTKGRNDMPAFGSALSPEQLQDVTSYVLQVAAPNPPQ